MASLYQRFLFYYLQTKYDKLERKANKYFEPLIEEARGNGDFEGVEVLEDQHLYELDLINDERKYSYTRRLLSEARRKHIQHPEVYQQDGETGYWERGHNGVRYLSVEGIAKLREDIRAEIRWKYERREHWLKWIPVITALTGLLGTIIGFLTVLKK